MIMINICFVFQPFYFPYSWQICMEEIPPFLPQETQSYKRNAMCMHIMLHQAGEPAPINYISKNLIEEASHLNNCKTTKQALHKLLNLHIPATDLET